MAVEIILIVLVGISILILFYPFISNLLQPKNRLGINGKLVWVDEGRNTKPFFNKQFEVLGKPDLMYKIKNGVLAVEYKSRMSVIYQSDIVQAKSAALAARGSGYNVIRILLKTTKTEKYIDLPQSDQKLYKDIESFVSIARRAKKGYPMKALPNVFKCRSCAYAGSCKHSVRG